MANNSHLFITILTAIASITVTYAGVALEDQRIESYAPCRYDSDCKRNAFCYDNDDVKIGKCKCKDGFELYRNRTDYECLPAVRLGDACEQDFQCKVLAGPMSVCNSSQLCDCNEFAHGFRDGLCYKSVKLTEPCLSDNNCKLSDGRFGFCTDGHCSCNLRERPSPDLTTCLLTKKLGERCFASLDCQIIPNSFCDEICRCRSEYAISRDGQSCLKAAVHFGDPCEEDDQCSKFLEFSVCNQGICSCSGDFHQYGIKCVKTAKLGERCTEDFHCIFDKNLEGNVNCAEGTCTCIYGPSKDRYGCKLGESGSSARPLITNTVIVGGLCTLLKLSIA